MADKYTPRLKQHYDEVIVTKLTEQFGYKNPMEVPQLDKIVLNMGIGEATADSKLVQVAVAELEKIAGQKAVITKARKAIATFKIRENLAIGAKVTLRKTRMYEFLDRLITIALPRVRDFRGLSGDELRRQRQLCDGHQGAHHFPGDRLRQDRPGLGSRCHRLHDGEDRRGGPRTARSIQFPVPQVCPQAGGVIGSRMN